ncbi:restriction endonuclease subunit S [Phenylobacterium sp.]|uniref:restriction endonuclease subunit S n=1 Tax=Phenylobacterium sp. TaxID=1871053 RepID=UPI00272F22C3|nr:restriction endonuclease subunit S [Phenylobacterium sp.]MDP1598716.1 restriction endonuclease subunit S [Phenylobacterium sp.]
MSWTSAALGDLFEIARGGSPRPIANYLTEADDGVNWVSISDATDSAKYIRSTKRKIKPAGVSRSRVVAPGDFLLTNSMSFGRPYIMATSGCIHDGWLSLSPKTAGTDPDYLFQVLSSPYTYRKFERLASGATVKNLNIDLVRGVEIPLPPLDEQRRIAAILDQADALRRKRREALAFAGTLKQALLECMLNHISHLESSSVLLAELVRRGDKINYGVVQPGDDFQDGVSLVRVGNIVDGDFRSGSMKQIDPKIEAQYQRSRLKGDEILVACVGSIGSVAIASPELAGANIARAVARIPSDPMKINREYLSEYLKSEACQRYFISETRTVAQPTLNIKQLSETPIPLPASGDQERFSQDVARIDALIMQSRESLKYLDALFASLQHRAFRGEL